MPVNANCCKCVPACIPKDELASFYTVTIPSNFVPQVGVGCWSAGEACTGDLFVNIPLSSSCEDSGEPETDYEVDDTGSGLCVGGFQLFHIVLAGTTCGWSVEFNIRDSDGSPGGMVLLYNQRTPGIDPVGTYDLDPASSISYCPGAAPLTLTVT